MRKRNRRVLALLLFAALLCACAQQAEETQAPTQPVETTVSQTETTAPEPTDPNAYLRENLPVMDGSTSLIPLEAGIRAALFDISLEEAALQVSHTSTWSSFYNLLEGNVDLVFSCPLSETQYETAAEKGITLETVPIAMEGFVFVVNAQNPVDTLTQEQLRGIYSGAITNWSEVGGLDEPITAYQRNADSGSQNYMIEFMGQTPLMDAPTQYRPASMSGLMDVIAVNDNARSAIGYSVYAYAADMYGNGNEIKFIQVDGVAPSKQTMASGKYPLMGYNYAVFNADEPADSPVRALVDWATSFEGQTAIAQAGYVTVEDIGFDYTEKTLSKYDALGTGAQAPSDTLSYEYVLHQSGQVFDCLALTQAQLPDGRDTYHATGLADKALQAEVNAFIDEQMALCWQAYDDYTAYVDRLNEGMEHMGYQLYYPRPSYEDYYCTYTDGMPAAVRVSCKNGYLSVAVAMCYRYGGMSETTCVYWAETANWDILTGERLEPEELFCEGVDIDQVLNDYLRQITLQSKSAWDYYLMKTDFAGLTLTGWHLTCDGIYFELDNPYFIHGAYISLDQLPDGTTVCQQARDFSEALDAGATYVRQQFRLLTRDTYYDYISGEVACNFLSEDAYPHAAAVNESVREYVNSYFLPEMLEAAAGNYSPVFPDWHMSNWGDRYVYFTTGWIQDYPYDTSLLFDLRTGERISWEDLLLPGWQEAVSLLSTSDAKPVEDPPGFEALTFSYIRTIYTPGIDIYFTNGGETYYISVPPEYINW